MGAVQNTYLTRRLNGICWINSAENLKSSILQTKYCPSTCAKSTKISWWKIYIKLVDVDKELRFTKDNLYNPQRLQETRASYCSLKLGCFSHGLPNLHFFLRQRLSMAPWAQALGLQVCTDSLSTLRLWRFSPAI